MSDRKIPNVTWTDDKLVGLCLQGDEEAWRILVDKYKNLVYSLILKYRPSPEEATDLFQGVWLDAFNDLAKLKKRGSFKSWLISVSNHKCYHWRQRQSRRGQHEIPMDEPETLEEHTVIAPDFVSELETQQLVREAIRQLSPRCQELLHLLFFAKPPKPYQEVAEQLGLAVGSIGFIRGRCLEKLKKLFEQLGL